MKKRDPAYPWCTGVPRPTLVTNLDAGEAMIFYYTVPILASCCKTAVIKLHGVVGIESRFVNDEENEYLRSGLMRDAIYEKDKGKQREYLFLFHNEVIVATADSLQELPGEETFMANFIRHHNPSFERE